MKQIAIIGDSITYGYDGRGGSTPYIAITLARLAGLSYTNLSISGATIGDKAHGVLAQVNRVNFANYQYALIEMGINDFRFPGETLAYMQASLQSAINKIHKDNPSCEIFLVTPLQCWDYNGASLDNRNANEFSQNDIDNMILLVARLNNLKSLDWRKDPIVTDANHTYTLGDGVCHPTAETQKKMAQRFFQVFFNGQKVSDSQPDQPVQPDKPVVPDKPKVDIQLDLIKTNSEILTTSNKNFQKIFKLLQQAASYEEEDSSQLGWQLENFTSYNRACYDYLVNTVKMIKRQVEDYLGDNEVVDDDFNDVTSTNLVIPEALDLQTFREIMNDDFKELASVLESISESM